MFKGIPKVSYSLIASYGDREELVRAISSLTDIGIDMIHFDVSAEEKTLSLDDLPYLIRHTDLPFDVHLAVCDPPAKIKNLKMRKIDYFCIHVENNYTSEQLRKLKQQLGCNFGLAINTETPVEKLYNSMNEIDFVLFMAAKPGVSGGSFNEEVIDKMITLRQLYPQAKIHVDGGINNRSAALLRDIGLDALISGSYILKDRDYSKQVAKLIGQNLNLPVSSIMHSAEDLPAVEEDSSINKVAKEIDDKKIGCACVIDENQRLKGLITDTDIRKFLIKEMNLSDYRAKDLMNSSPFVVSPDKNLIKLVRELEEMGLFFTVVPVVEDSGRCVGVLRLQDIIFSNVHGLRIRHL